MRCAFVAAVSLLAAACVSPSTNDDPDPNAGLFTEMLMVGIAQGDDEAKRRLRDFLERKAGKVVRS